MLYICVVLAAFFAFSTADQTSWVGTYADPTYGGNLAVCVTQVGSTFYGQGLISDVGYLRGTIDVNNVWTGDVFFAGTAAEHGNFTLTLAGSTASYSGSYYQAGSGITYTVTNAARNSSTKPADTACFNVDASMLTMTAAFNLTGAWQSCGGASCHPIYLSVMGTTATSSYTYQYEDGTVVQSTSQGTTFLNGQVITDNWYDSGSGNGIEIVVAKNSTHVFSLWWYLPSLSDFDYSLQADDYFGAPIMALDTALTSAQVISYAYDNVCYALWTEAAEASCLITAADDDSSNSFESEDHNLLITSVVFTVATFTVGAGLLVFLLVTGALGK